MEGEGGDCARRGTLAQALGGLLGQGQGEERQVARDLGDGTGEDDRDDACGSGLRAQAGGGDLLGEQLGAGTLGVESEDDTGAGGCRQREVPGNVVERTVRGLASRDDQRVIAGRAHGLDRRGKSGGGTQGRVRGARAGKGINAGGGAQDAGELLRGEGGCLRRAGGDNNETGHSNCSFGCERITVAT